MWKGMWHPAVPAIGLAWFVARLAITGVTLFRVIALLWMCLWLGLAIYNRTTGGRWLDT